VRKALRWFVTRVRNFSDWAYWRLHLEAVVDADPCPIDTIDDFEEWCTRTRRRVRDLLGSEPAAVAPEAETTESVDCGSYRRERIVIDTEATMAMPAYLLVPHERTEPGTAALAIHGHGPGKALLCGIVDGGPGDDYAHRLACAGHVVFVPDLRGFGERAGDDIGGRYHCDWNLVCATMAGVVPLARNLWDLRCALDFLAAHPLVANDRIAGVGFSYGGTCSLFLAALDERVAATVVSGYLSSWRAAHTVPWNMCGSQVLPGQLGAVEHRDVAALIAPRPLLVESGTEDVVFPLPAAERTVAELRKVYAALGAPDALVHSIFAGDHRWHGAGVEPFLETALRSARSSDR
jgi:dienelactone hydrolase